MIIRFWRKTFTSPNTDVKSQFWYWVLYIYTLFVFAQTLLIYSSYPKLYIHSALCSSCSPLANWYQLVAIYNDTLFPIAHYCYYHFCCPTTAQCCRNQWLKNSSSIQNGVSRVCELEFIGCTTYIQFYLQFLRLFRWSLPTMYWETELQLHANWIRWSKPNP